MEIDTGCRWADQPNCGDWHRVQVGWSAELWRLTQGAGGLISRIVEIDTRCRWADQPNCRQFTILRPLWCRQQSSSETSIMQHPATGFFNPPPNRIIIFRFSECEALTLLINLASISVCLSCTLLCYAIWNGFFAVGTVFMIKLLLIRISLHVPDVSSIFVYKVKVKRAFVQALRGVEV